MNIAGIRQKYPQYKDLSDQQLADGMHTKFYSDMPKTDFYSKIGLQDKLVGKGGKLVGGIVGEAIEDPRSLKAVETYAVKGLAFGLSDELKALGKKGGQAIERKIYGDVIEPELPYKEQRDVYRAEAEKLKEEYPKQALGGEILGGIASPIGGIAKKGVGMAIKGAGKLATLGRVAGTGAVEGGIYGAGETKDISDIPQTLQDVKEYGMFGAGAAVGLVGIAGAGKLALKPLKSVTGRITPKRAEAQSLIKSLKKEGVTPEKAREGLQKMQDEGTALIDVIDPRSSVIAKIPERTFEKATIDTIDNYTTQLNRVGNKAKTEVLDLVSKKKISPTEGAELIGQNASEVISRQKKIRSAKAKPLYDKAKNDFIPKNDEILQRPVVRDAIEKAKAESAKFGEKTPGSLYEKTIDRIKGKSDLSNDDLISIKGAYSETEKELNKIKKPKSLIQFIKETGGIIDKQGDLASRELGKQRPFVLRKGGKGNSVDEVGEKLYQAGYFTERPTESQVLDAIDSELRGKKIFAQDSIDTQMRGEELGNYLDNLIYELDVRGLDIDKLKNLKDISEVSPYADNSLAVLHQAKDYLYRQSKDFNNLEATRYAQVYRELSDKLKKASPNYKKATEIWAGETKGLEELYKQKGIGNIAKKYEKNDIDGIRSSVKNVFKKTITDEEIVRLKKNLPEEQFNSIVRKDLDTLIDEAGDKGSNLTTSLFGKGDVERSLKNKRLDLVFSSEQKKGLKKTTEVFDNIRAREKQLDKIAFRTPKQQLEYIYGGQYAIANAILKTGRALSDSPQQREAFVNYLFTQEGKQILEQISKGNKSQIESIIVNTLPAIITQKEAQNGN